MSAMCCDQAVTWLAVGGSGVASCAQGGEPAVLESVWRLRCALLGGQMTGCAAEQQGGQGCSGHH